MFESSQRMTHNSLGRAISNLTTPAECRSEGSRSRQCSGRGDGTYGVELVRVFLANIHAVITFTQRAAHLEYVGTMTVGAHHANTCSSTQNNAVSFTSHRPRSDGQISVLGLIDGVVHQNLLRGFLGEKAFADHLSYGAMNPGMENLALKRAMTRRRLVQTLTAALDELSDSESGEI